MTAEAECRGHGGSSDELVIVFADEEAVQGVEVGVPNELWYEDAVACRGSGLVDEALRKFGMTGQNDSSGKRRRVTEPPPPRIAALLIVVVMLLVARQVTADGSVAC